MAEGQNKARARELAVKLVGPSSAKTGRWIMSLAFCDIVCTIDIHLRIIFLLEACSAADRISLCGKGELEIKTHGSATTTSTELTLKEGCNQAILVGILSQVHKSYRALPSPPMRPDEAYGFTVLTWCPVSTPPVAFAAQVIDRFSRSYSRCVSGSIKLNVGHQRRCELKAINREAFAC